MKKASVLKTGLWGGVIGGAVIGVSFFGHLLAGLPFIPFDIFDWLARVLPGRLIAFTIETMVGLIRILHLGPTASTAKLAEQGLALIQFAATWAILGLILGIVVRRRPGRGPAAGTLGGAVLAASALYVEWTKGFPDAGPVAASVWLTVLFMGGGILLGRTIESASSRTPASTEEAISRRRFLQLAGTGSFIVMVTAAGVSVATRKGKKIVQGMEQEEFTRAAQTSGPAASPPAEELEKRFPAVAGTRSELTRNEDFYRIDINLRPPKINGEAWRLKVEGLVERPLDLSLQDIRSRPRQTQAITLSCISNPLGGDLISTSFWTGLPFAQLLAEAGLKPGVQEIFIESADGFYESVPLREANDPRTLLVYEMNGEPLPVEHGFPLRISIPGHFGMKQPKWIKRIEAIDHSGPGYWVDRSWSRTALVQTTSVIDVAAVGKETRQNGQIPIGGIAYAGDRGISLVEVQVDNGPWEKAELRLPGLSPLTWVQWRFFWKPIAGKHTVRVRATDGMGTIQATESRPPYPDGATGIHRVEANISR